MPVLTLTKVFDAQLDHMLGVSTLEVRGTNTTGLLYTASEVDGGLSVFSLAEDQAATLMAQRACSDDSGTLGVQGLSLGRLGGSDMLISAGRYDDSLAIQWLDADGSFDAITTPDGGSMALNNPSVTEIVSIGSLNFLALAQLGQPGFSLFRMDSDGSFERTDAVEAMDGSAVADTSAFAAASVSGAQYLFVSSGFGDAVTSYRIDGDGTLTFADTLGAADGIGINAPSCMDVASLSGRDYLIMGNAGSGSLSVMGISPLGELTLTDHVFDDAFTRFAGTAAVETIDYNGRTLVFAGGHDDGISVFDLSADGALYHIGTMADDFDTTLQNISSISALQVGEEIQVFVSGSEPGFTQFSVNLDDLGRHVIGSENADRVTGGSKDDLLVGFGGQDVLMGNSGDDRLIDGAGMDFAIGGAGQDCFVFEADRKIDFLLDFEDGQDIIDLSRYETVRNMDQINTFQMSSGVFIVVPGDYLWVASRTLSTADLTADDFVF